VSLLHEGDEEDGAGVSRIRKWREMVPEDKHYPRYNMLGAWVTRGPYFLWKDRGGIFHKVRWTVLTLRGERLIALAVQEELFPDDVLTHGPPFRWASSFCHS
jgi:hypothetical protein